MKDTGERAEEDRETLETNACLTPMKEKVGKGVLGKRGSGFCAGEKNLARLEG